MLGGSHLSRFTWSNWKKIVLALCILILLMLFPITRRLIFLILPLGSGIDDLIFFILLFLLAVMLLLRTVPVKDKLAKLAKWLTK